MTELDLDAMKALEAAATPGPWEAGGIGEFGFHVLGPAGGIETDDTEQGRADAEFIAAARNALPALLDRLAEAERELTDFRAWLEYRDLPPGTSLKELIEAERETARLAAGFELIEANREPKATAMNDG